MTIHLPTSPEFLPKIGAEINHLIRQGVITVIFDFLGRPESPFPITVNGQEYVCQTEQEVMDIIVRGIK